MDSIGHLIGFPMPTHTHVFGNHINGYGHSKIDDVRSSADCRKKEPSVIQTWTCLRKRRGLRFLRLSFCLFD
jgi:hypothetical protein